MFWPSMNSAIEETVHKCEICAKSQPLNNKEPMIKMELPDKPYCKIGVDILEIKGVQYLASVDYFFKWPEVSRLENMQSKLSLQS